MAKKMSKTMSIVLSVILAVAFVVLAVFTFGRFQLSRGREYTGILSAVQVGSDINDIVVVEYTLAEEEGKVERAKIEKSVEIIRKRLNITSFATAQVKATSNGFIATLPSNNVDSQITSFLFGQGKMTFETSTKTYLTEEGVKSAEVQKSYAQDGINVSATGYSVAINFTKAGQEAFYQATKEAMSGDNKTVTIKMDGNTLFAPQVSEEMNSPSVQIGGGYTKVQAEIIASAINNGVLGYSFENHAGESRVSSVLGENASLKIILGLLAIFVVVAVLFIVFYKGLGVIADIVLLFAIELFILVFTLIPNSIITIPALIGLIVSFAVLCVILVVLFERIKAEFALGKTINSSINSAFKKSYMLAIDVAIFAIIVFLASFFIVNAYLKTFIVAFCVSLAVVAFVSWLITRGLIALFKGFVNQESFYNLVKEEVAE